MSNAERTNEKDFPEWMITQALATYLGRKGSENCSRMGWLFDLEAETPDGNRELKRLCGFDWNTTEVRGGPEESFKATKDDCGDRGAISVDDFRKVYMTITPDFRYWTSGREKQLIIKAKGTPKPSGQRDRVQAERYFSHLRDSGFRGAVVYFVPNPKTWLAWLTGIAGNSPIPLASLT